MAASRASVASKPGRIGLYEPQVGAEAAWLAGGLASGLTAASAKGASELLANPPPGPLGDRLRRVTQAANRVRLRAHPDSFGELTLSRLANSVEAGATAVLGLVLRNGPWNAPLYAERRILAFRAAWADWWGDHAEACRLALGHTPDGLLQRAIHVALSADERSATPGAVMEALAPQPAAAATPALAQAGAKVPAAPASATPVAEGARSPRARFRRQRGSRGPGRRSAGYGSRRRRCGRSLVVGAEGDSGRPDAATGHAHRHAATGRRGGQ